MKLALLPAFLISSAFLAPSASATVVSFGPINQPLTFTGLGANSQGLGTSRVTWGTCAFVANTNTTTCTVTAPFTGLGGGTIAMVVTYQGNGPVPLTATSQTPGSDVFILGLTAGTIVTTLTENSGAVVNFYFTNITFSFINPTCTGVSSCSVGQVGNVVNATINGTGSGQFDATPIIRTSQGVISASAFGGFNAVAPGSWMEIYGTNLANVRTGSWDSGFVGNQAPTNVAGTTVTIGGLPAFIDFVSPGQVNAQVPSGIDPGNQPVVVTTAGGASTAFIIPVKAVEPGLLAPPVFNLPAGQYVAATFPDGITFVLPPVAGAPTARAKPGDTIIFYGVGFGPVTPASPAGQIVTVANKLSGTFTASFAGVPAVVNFQGLTGGYLGLYQFNVVVPSVAASDAVPFTYSLNGVAGPQNLIIAITK